MRYRRFRLMIQNCSRNEPNPQCGRDVRADLAAQTAFIAHGPWRLPDSPALSMNPAHRGRVADHARARHSFRHHGLRTDPRLVVASHEYHLPGGPRTWRI